MPATLEMQREILGPALYQEMLPLLELHYREIAHYSDIELDPDFETYLKLEEIGALRIFTARDEAGRLIGYAVYFVRANLHYRRSLQANQDILYVDPKRRGCGARLIAWADEALAREGVQVVYHHVKAAHNFGRLLERQGYRLVDLIYSKRLDSLPEPMSANAEGAQSWQ